MKAGNMITELAYVAVSSMKNQETWQK